MNRKAFERFFQKPEGFFWDNELQMYYEHKDFRFVYKDNVICEFNCKWQGWLACQQMREAE